MKYYHRLSGTLCTLPHEPLVFGEFLVAGETTGAPHFVNNARVDPHDPLFPDHKGEWKVSVGQESVDGSFYAGASLDAPVSAALHEFARTFCDPKTRSDGWLGWIEKSPVAMGELAKTIQHHAVENVLAQQLGHLRTVCFQPETHVHVEEDRILASRARKLSHRAGVVLSAHPEDWAARRVMGVEPRRILACVREPLWELYENKVTARLVDHLETWLRRRIHLVERTQQEIFSRLDNDSDLAKSNRHRFKRLCELWGDAVEQETADAQSEAKSTLANLHRLLYAVLGLKNTPLYRRVSRTAQVPLMLNMTNLFANDPHYRGVARLWSAWVKSTYVGALSPEDRKKAAQELSQGMDAWCMVLVLRACAQLGFEPTQDNDALNEVKPGTAWCLSGHLSKALEVRWAPTGEIFVSDNNGWEVRFIPLLHDLSHEPNTDSEVTQKILRKAAKANTWTVVLWAAQPDQNTETDRLRSLDPPYPPTDGTDTDPADFLRLLPMSLDNVEHIARIVLWGIVAPQMLRYPPKVLFPFELERREPSAWKVPERPGDAYTLVKPLHRTDPTMTDLNQKLHTRSSDLEKLRKDEARIAEDLKKSLDDRRSRGDLNARKRNILEPIRNAERAVQSLQEAQQKLEEAQTLLDRLAICPACGKNATAFENLDRDTYKASCSSTDCDSVWGIRYDNRCADRIPFLQRGDVDKPVRGDAERAAMWAMDILGRDMLAVPYLDEKNDVRYRCPRKV